MAISGTDDEAGTPLLAVTVDGSVDYRSEPAVRSSTGGWRSAGFIIGNFADFPAIFVLLELISSEILVSGLFFSLR